MHKLIKFYLFTAEWGGSCLYGSPSFCVSNYKKLYSPLYIKGKLGIRAGLAYLDTKRFLLMLVETFILVKRCRNVKKLGLDR